MRQSNLITSPLNDCKVQTLLKESTTSSAGTGTKSTVSEGNLSGKTQVGTKKYHLVSKGQMCRSKQEELGIVTHICSSYSWWLSGSGIQSSHPKVPYNICSFENTALGMGLGGVNLATYPTLYTLWKSIAITKPIFWHGHMFSLSTGTRYPVGMTSGIRKYHCNPYTCNYSLQLANMKQLSGITGVEEHEAPSWAELLTQSF